MGSIYDELLEIYKELDLLNRDNRGNGLYRNHLSGLSDRVYWLQYILIDRI